MRRGLALVGTIATVALLVGCGGTEVGTGEGNAARQERATTSSVASASPNSEPATVSVAATSEYGKILVDGEGRTLYLFEPDQNATSTCYGRCAEYWPPLTTKGSPQAGSGAVEKFLGTTERRNGTTQVTYRGHPLYYYISDRQPGDVYGQLRDEFGAWYVLSPNGKKIDTY